VQNSWMGPQLDKVAADGNAGRPAIEGWITLPIAEQLLKASGHGYRELLLAASKPGFRAIDLKQKASGALRNAIRRSSSPNVMAMLPGSKYPNEYVVYMAHWDHLGRTLARSGDNIFNGAVDNATGTSGLLTIAQGFVAAKEKPERSVVFLALTCEECGLLGSAYYVANPVLPLADTVAALNMDGYHFGGPTRDVTVVGNGASELEDYLRSAAKLQDRVLRDEPTPEKGFYFRSDHFNFAKGGVPALYIESGLDDREHGIEWAKARNAEYITKDYHKPSDEFRPGSDLRGGMENIELMFAVGMQIARERRFQNWRVDSEFRAARDRSRAAAAGSGASAR
jgi:Zn-dependent M28 family amino/carboxypeptidase